MNSNELSIRLAERMHKITKDLLRKYQLRDRNEITCCGISVSQCYALDILGEQGEMTMAGLAQYMYLEKSTVTRIVDQLIKRELVERRQNESDRRKVHIALTESGKKLRQEILDCQISSQKQILEQIPESKREMALEGLELLSSAIQEWLATCCLPTNVKIPKENLIKGASHERHE